MKITDLPTTKALSMDEHKKINAAHKRLDPSYKADWFGALGCSKKAHEHFEIEMTPKRQKLLDDTIEWCEKRKLERGWVHGVIQA